MRLYVIYYIFRPNPFIKSLSISIMQYGFSEWVSFYFITEVHYILFLKNVLQQILTLNSFKFQL